MEQSQAEHEEIGISLDAPDHHQPYHALCQTKQFQKELFLLADTFLLAERKKEKTGLK